MALIKLGYSCVALSGSIGGITIAKDDSGLHIRTKTLRVKSSTPNQLRVRKAYAKAVNQWPKAAPFRSDRRRWLQYATYPETAFNAFVRISWYYAFNNQIIPRLPPL